MSGISSDVFSSATESLRRTQEFAAGGSVALQMRRMQELAAGGAIARELHNLRQMGAGHLHSVGAAVDGGRLFSKGASEPVTRMLDAVNPMRRFYATASGPSWHQIHELKLMSRIEAAAKEVSAAPSEDDDHDGMRAFIQQQSVESKDEAAQAACCRYILRNRLLE